MITDIKSCSPLIQCVELEGVARRFRELPGFVLRLPSAECDGGRNQIIKILSDCRPSKKALKCSFTWEYGNWVLSCSIRTFLFLQAGSRKMDTTVPWFNTKKWNVGCFSIFHWDTSKQNNCEQLAPSPTISRVCSGWAAGPSIFCLPQLLCITKPEPLLGPHCKAETLAQTTLELRREKVLFQERHRPQDMVRMK